ncbi:MAG: D-alanyl-D-alanine carboxypeptidase [Ruminococcaceae bacterium]|nr:D-alanyl-D-alanine carboxypeptidase [Oscillospiraceae bacterium]
MKHRLIRILVFALSAVFLCSCPGALFTAFAEGRHPGSGIVLTESGQSENGIISTKSERFGAMIADVRVSVGVSARAAVLMEETTGTILFAKNADARLPMASTTKIMTALVALENADPDLLISTPKEAVGTEGSSIYLFEGETLSLEELLWALLLNSANDAAVAIAFGVAGGVEPFAALMNEKALALGLENTHFVNPHGLDDPDHYTTARDLAIIARAALANPMIREMVSTRKKVIPHNGTDGVRLLVNHNKLLRLYDGAFGVKTGYTKRTGRCLVSAAARDGLSLVAVTLDAPSDWNDHRAMLDAGFAAVSALLLAKAGEIVLSLPVVGGVSNQVSICNSEPAEILLPSGHGEITRVIELPRFLYAGFSAGEIVGRAVWYADGKEIAQTSFIATEAVEKPKKENWLISLWKKIFHIE